MLQKKDMLIQAAKDETFRYQAKAAEQKQEIVQLNEIIKANSEQYIQLDKEKQELFFQLQDIKAKNEGSAQQITQMHEEIMYLKDRLKGEILNTEQLSEQLKTIMAIMKEKETDVEKQKSLFEKTKGELSDQLMNNSFQIKTMSKQIEDKNYELKKSLA